MNQPLIDQIDAVLPQTQCGKCGYSGCRPYAEAIANGQADINQCPPGSQDGILKIAELLGVPPKPLNTAHGFPPPYKAVAIIDERLCIGCTFCLKACPVDAIAGAAKQMHTVIAAECTGCELCIAPCPMDCIRLIPADENATGTDNLPAAARKQQIADHARTRYQRRQQRLERDKQRAAEKPVKLKTGSAAENTKTIADERKKAMIEAALARAKMIRAQTRTADSPVNPHELS
ncbi:MAG: electron transport complex subunit RsxB [Nitrosomonas sp.]|uniref:electron transport complex subunit RsxB n=1 Tax=Nitrosomonas sp. TaxID=42353 RepID=UPI001E0B4B2A|nr:electron transport complex subunit RsxB [Nitrosomonas sp.]MBX9893773.1 electron transport complex subunit RsxB [Nitrosomonas sp.]